MPSRPPRRDYWAANLRITRVLLGIWFAVTFGVGYFARDLSFSFFGWPFSFWAAAQGALIVYCAIIWFYAYAMNRMDQTYRDADASENHAAATSAVAPTSAPTSAPTDAPTARSPHL